VRHAQQMCECRAFALVPFGRMSQSELPQQRLGQQRRVCCSSTKPLLVATREDHGPKRPQQRALQRCDDHAGSWLAGGTKPATSSTSSTQAVNSPRSSEVASAAASQAAPAGKPSRCIAASSCLPAASLASAEADSVPQPAARTTIWPACGGHCHARLATRLRAPLQCLGRAINVTATAPLRFESGQCRGIAAVGLEPVEQRIAPGAMRGCTQQCHQPRGSAGSGQCPPGLVVQRDLCTLEQGSHASHHQPVLRDQGHGRLAQVECLEDGQRGGLGFIFEPGAAQAAWRRQAGRCIERCVKGGSASSSSTAPPDPARQPAPIDQRITAAGLQGNPRRGSPCPQDVSGGRIGASSPFQRHAGQPALAGRPGRSQAIASRTPAQ